MLRRISFARLLVVLLALAFVAGFATFILSGATTNKGTTSAILAESSKIRIAERANCSRYGVYATIPTLRREGLLTFQPVYNSVVILPGKHCGTIVIGSPADQ